MARSLTAGMQTAVAAQTGTITYFIQVTTSAGDVFLTTAPMDISWNGQSWQGVGGAMAFGPIQETTDPIGQGVELTLSGVDQSIISLVLSNSFRGHQIRIWLAFVSNGAIVADPVELFRGVQLADYNVREVVSQEGNSGTCTITTTVQSLLAAMRGPLPVRSNIHSHNDMLKRAGITTGDTFFRNVPDIAGKNILWGVPGFTRGDRPPKGTAKRRRT